MVDDQFTAFESVDEISRKISAIDGLINVQLNEILHHAEFKALEAAWRGLHYLVNETDPGLKVKILMSSIAKRELVKGFELAEEFDRSQIYHKIFTDIYSNIRGMPFGMLIGAYEFGNHPQDIYLLEQISQISALAHAPFIAAVSPEMFGLETFGEMIEVSDAAEILKRPEYAGWQKFRESDGAEYVGLCLPHVLLREPYRKSESSSFQESAAKENLLWGNAAFAFGACVARAYKEKSWLGQMQGIDDDGVVENLCSYAFDVENELNRRSSLDARLNTLEADVLSVEGFISLINPQGTDRTGIFSSHSTKKPREYDTVRMNYCARASIKLENILAVSRFAVNLMCLNRDWCDLPMSRREREIFLMRWLTRYYDYERLEDYDTTNEEVKARYPLGEAIVNVIEVPGKLDEFRAVMFIRPVYQVEDLLVAMRTVVYLPDPRVLLNK